MKIVSLEFSGGERSDLPPVGEIRKPDWAEGGAEL